VVVKATLKLHFKSKIKSGIAPKTGVERRIEAILRKLKIWHTMKGN
jgi:hypothetical protein